MNKLKILIICILSIIALKCTSQSKYKIDKTFYTKENIILIADIETDGKFNLSKTDFNYIVDKFPELYQYPPQAPYETYINSPMLNSDSCFNDENLRYYTCEGGQDKYYLLYAYFLKKKNGIQKFEDQRYKLITIRQTINYFNSYFFDGGTMFSHAHRRILADVEFEIYQHPNSDTSFNLSNNYVEKKKIKLDSIKKLILECEKEEIDSIEKSIFESEKISLDSIKKEIHGDKQAIDKYLDNYINKGDWYNDIGDLIIENKTNTEMQNYRKRILLEKVNLLDKLISNNYYFEWSQP